MISMICDFHCELSLDWIQLNLVALSLTFVNMALKSLDENFVKIKLDFAAW